MSYVGYLEELLRPMGVYQPGAVFHTGELVSAGEQLDGVAKELEDIQQEMCLTTAEDWGVQQMGELFVVRPIVFSQRDLAEAYASLLRISGDGFTVDALNQTISGCGTRAFVEETDTYGVVQVSFPNVPGMPTGFRNICKIIEDILPAHLGVTYLFWYITWGLLEQKIPRFAVLTQLDLTWRELEALVL